ncbi:hypothetical protein KEM54_002222 [Ascosphaera aggregata]|nr:hypothetical protein KEM54_002222 [Ascosphaera aggregata]
MAPHGFVTNSDLPATSIFFLTSDKVTLNCSTCHRSFGYTANRFVEHLSLRYPIEDVVLKDSCVSVDQHDDDDPLLDEAREDVWKKAAKNGIKVDGVQWLSCPECSAKLAAWVTRDTRIGGKVTMLGLEPYNVYLTANDSSNDRLTANCLLPSKKNATGVAKFFFNLAAPNSNRHEARAPPMQQDLNLVIQEIHDTLSLLHSEQRHFQLEARRERETSSSVDWPSLTLAMTSTILDNKLQRNRITELEKENADLKGLLGQIGESRLCSTGSQSIDKGHKRAYRAALGNDDSDISGDAEDVDDVAARHRASPCHSRRREFSAIKRTRPAQDRSQFIRSTRSASVGVAQGQASCHQIMRPRLPQKGKDQPQQKETGPHLLNCIVGEAEKLEGISPNQLQEYQNALASRDLPHDKVPLGDVAGRVSVTLSETTGEPRNREVNELLGRPASKQVIDQAEEENAIPIAHTAGYNGQPEPSIPRIETQTESQQVTGSQQPTARHSEAALRDHENHGDLLPPTFSEPALTGIPPPSTTHVSLTTIASEAINLTAETPLTEPEPAFLHTKYPHETEPIRGRGVSRARGRTRGRVGRPRNRGGRRRPGRPRKNNTPASQGESNDAEVTVSYPPQREESGLTVEEKRILDPKAQATLMRVEKKQEPQGSAPQQGAVARQVNEQGEQNDSREQHPVMGGGTAPVSRLSGRNSGRLSLPLVEIHVDNNNIGRNLNDYAHIHEHNSGASHTETTKVVRVERPKLVSRRRSRASVTTGTSEAAETMIDLTGTTSLSPPMGAKDTAHSAEPKQQEHPSDAPLASDKDDWNAQVAARDRLAKKVMILEEMWE